MKKITLILAFVATSAALNERLYTDLVFMAKNRVGCDDFNVREADLLNYLQQAFEVDDETHNATFQKAKNLEAQIMHLTVEVKEARNLVWRDPNGKIDPYCILSLTSNPSKCYRTAVKNATVDPVWNESFELKLEKPENDVLCFEVWNFDLNESVLVKISKIGNSYGLQRFWKSTKEINKAPVNVDPNQFVGCCIINLSNILVAEETGKWYPLVKPGKLGNGGDVHLRLSFTAESNAETAVREYRYLMSTLLSHELKTKTPEFVWGSVWSPAGATLLHQYQARKGLQSTNVWLSQWIVYSNMIEEYPVDSVFNKLAEKLVQPMAEELFSSAERKAFWEGAKKVLHSCFNSIKKLPMSSDSNGIVMTLRDTSGIISSISKLTVPEGLDLFPSEMYDWLPESVVTKIDILQMLEYAVIEGGDASWRRLLPNKTMNIPTDENTVDYWILIVQLITDQLQIAANLYDDITIKKNNFSYAQALYKAHEERISDLCMSIAKDVCPTLEPISITGDANNLTLVNKLRDLYKALQRFVMYDARVDRPKSSKMHGYQKWFRDCVEPWLDAEMHEARARIEEAVGLDNFESIVASGFTSSALDVAITLNEMKAVWTQLDWPDVKESLRFVERVAERSCEVCDVYARMILEKAGNITWTDEKWKTRRVSTVSCFAINDIDYVQKSIALWGSDLQRIFESIGDSETQRESRLEHLIDHNIEILENRTVECFKIFGQEMATYTRRYLMERADSFVAPISSDDMKQLFEYINDNIDVLNTHLSENNFGTAVAIIWEEILKELYQEINNKREEETVPLFYSNFNLMFKDLSKGFSYFVATDFDASVEIIRKIESVLNDHR